ncbi:YeeE/YedE family protein [Chromatiaceae bacterium AAb-1]|jgi:uncharacterized membrane protein YedE/YeeE|nr:YeeE/YedE family protein [Chromatiaceae bacterium AAb-1]
MPLLIAFLSGLLMSAGIIVSQMVNPEKVLAFLNVTDNWDPSLLLVMAAALCVYTIGYQLTLRRQNPCYAASFNLPAKGKVDLSLVLGAALFGTGWGLSGYCPGPAIIALSSGSIATLGFCAAMITGWFISRRINMI